MHHNLKSFTSSCTHRRLKTMKSLACITFALLCANTIAHSQTAETVAKLGVQTMMAEPAHLTTRIEWVKFPKVDFQDSDLSGRDRVAIVRVKANESGKVVEASIKESTGLAKLDQKLVNAVFKSKTKPFVKEGNELSIIGYQVFSLNLSENDGSACTYTFDSKVWNAQQADQKVPFQYLTQPKLNINTDDLNNHNRKVKFSFKVNKHGEVKSSKITKGSGLYRLDQQILSAVNHAKVDVPRKYWIYKKSKLKDEIIFDISHCN